MIEKRRDTQRKPFCLYIYIYFLFSVLRTPPPARSVRREFYINFVFVFVSRVRAGSGGRPVVTSAGISTAALNNLIRPIQSSTITV